MDSHAAEEHELDQKRPLLPDSLVFPVESITEPIEAFPVLNAFVSVRLAGASAENAKQPETSSEDSAAMHNELARMKRQLLAKQKDYQEQFSQLQEWMRRSFEVDSLDVLVEHQAKCREAELAAEELATQGTSKQHQRIRTLSLNLASDSESTSRQRVQTHDDSGSRTESASVASSAESPPPTAPARSAKSTSRMNHAAGAASTGGQQPQGQKDLSATKPKIPNQIPITTFWNYIEPIFKPIDEDDMKFLDDPSHVLDVAPFTIPPLGLHYENIWYEQYGYVIPGNESKRRLARSVSEPLAAGKGPVSLRDRLLSALVDSNASVSLADPEDEFLEELPMDGDAELNSDALVSAPAPMPLDDRIRTSLVELGFTDLTVARDYMEDDEICVEIRSVQRQLREHICVNQYRKRRLAEFIRTKLASQEFYALIGDIDKQIDGFFQRRIKSSKKKKKTVATTATGAATTQTESGSQSCDVPAEAQQCLDNRQRLLSAFADVVPPRIEAWRPRDLVDFDLQVEEDIVQQAKRSSSWMPLPTIPLKYPLSSCQPAFPNARPNQ